MIIFTSYLWKPVVAHPVYDCTCAQNLLRFHAKYSSQNIYIWNAWGNVFLDELKMIYIAFKVIITLLPRGCKHHKVTCHETHVLPACFVNTFSQLSRSWGHPPSGGGISELIGRWSSVHATYCLWAICQPLAQSWDGLHYLPLAWGSWQKHTTWYRWLAGRWRLADLARQGELRNWTPWLWN